MLKGGQSLPRNVLLMAFVDEVTIYARAGKGGDGVVRWLRTKETARGGPSGGDGGRGGDVFLEGVRDLEALAHYRYEKKFLAEDGESGRGELQQGKEGAPVILRVPVGTTVTVQGTGAVYEVLTEGERRLILRGGSPGKGNARFKSATHQNPFERSEGKPGQEGDLHLELKLMADAGLVGLPNAGKSSLLKALTRAQPKVGNYPFTTLEPNLGAFYGHILADIPGLIAGASSGKGLGTKFLKHVERTGFLLHLVSSEQDDPATTYNEVRAEINAFSKELSKKREVVVLTKTDLLSTKEVSTKIAALKKASKAREVYSVSIEDPEALKAFSDNLTGLFAA